MAALFDTIQFRDMTLGNRIVVAPMCQYAADDSALVNDWHVVHYGSMALGGPALIIVEATAVEARGRISTADLGIYEDHHVGGLSKLVEFAHRQGVKMGIQLAHAGRKADLPGEIVAPSALAFSERYQVPNDATVSDIQDIVSAFEHAAVRAVEAGFDCIEIHAAHGYLLHQFLSPTTNQRSDEYGGSLEKRMRLPLQIVDVVRGAIPESMPLFIRISGSEYIGEGYTLADMTEFSRACKTRGVDLIHVSSGGNAPDALPHVYPGYQVPFAEAIKIGADIPVAAVGVLDDPILAENILQSGRADLIAIARGFLRNKHWGHDAAIQLKKPVHPPAPYARAYQGL